MPTIRRKLEIFVELMFYIRKEKRLKQELQSSQTKSELLRTSSIIEDLIREHQEPTTDTIRDY
jgi:hypothetical protein